MVDINHAIRIPNFLLGLLTDITTAYIVDMSGNSQMYVINDNGQRTPEFPLQIGRHDDTCLHMELTDEVKQHGKSLLVQWQVVQFI